jgi:hypothetical protein
VATSNPTTAPAAAAPPAKTPALRPLPAAKAIKKPVAANTYIAIVAGITALIVIVCLFVGYRLGGRIILDVKVIAKEAEAKSALTTKLSDANTLVSNYNNLGNSQQQLIADALPNSPQFTQLVALMNSLANASGVQIKSMSPTAGNGGVAQAPTTSASPSTTPMPYVFSVEVEGPYGQVVNYFQNLELSARPMRVLTSSFQGTSSDLKATVDIQTYYQSTANISDQQVTVK